MHGDQSLGEMMAQWMVFQDELEVGAVWMQLQQEVLSSLLGQQVENGEFVQRIPSTQKILGEERKIEERESGHHCQGCLK